MSDFYILDNRKVVKTDLKTWVHMQRDPESMRVADMKLGGVQVSTVFVGGLINSLGSGPPLPFETMVFGGLLDGERERCASWEQAEAMHEQTCNRVRAGAP